MLNRSKLIYLVIFLTASHSILAQENKAQYTYSVGADVFGGFIIKHRDVIGHLIKGHPTGVRLSFNRYSYGHKAWEQRYGYPTFSVIFSYYDLKNDEVLGRAMTLNTGLSFHLNNHTQSKNDFQAYLGFGLAYVTKTYNEDTNNKNILVSAPFPWSINLKLAYDRQLSPRVKIGTAVQLSHFSNAARKLPNLGLNVLNLNFGARYMLFTEKPAYKTDKLTVRDYSDKIYFNADIRIGFNEKKPIGSGVSPYYAVAAFWNKRVSGKSIVDAGLEGFFNKAYKAEIENKQPLIKGYPDYRSFAFMVGHELILRKLALVTQVGVYFYKPYNPGDRVYFKVGLKYYFTEHVYASLILKSHYAVAEVLEYGIGIRF